MPSRPRPKQKPARHEKVVRARLADYLTGKSKPIPHRELMRRLRAREPGGRI